MYSEALSEETIQAVDKIKKCSFAQKFYLAGGTALAIQIGHRKSIDLDFFSRETIDVANLKKELSNVGKLTIVSEDKNTLNCNLDNVKISFFRYGYDLMYPIVDFEGMKIADIRDIAAMKIDTIASRGSKKDFIDFYFLLEIYNINEIIRFFEKKFSNISYNELHILKSLTYFEDAKSDPMPIMLKHVSWETIKTRIISETKNLTF